MRWIGVVVIVAASSTAHAEDAPPLKAGPYEITSAPGKGTEVRKGKQRAPLDAKLYHSGGTSENNAKKVTLQMMGDCVYQPYDVTYTYDELEARIANTAGLVLHRAKKHAEAAAKFAAAVKLDPAWDLPVYNLASAYNMAGDTRSALAALAPRLASNPVATYAAVVADPQLVSLLIAPELVALKAKTAVAKPAMHDLDYAYSPERGLLAYRLSSSGWLSCMGDLDIVIVDVATAKEVATLPLARTTDYIGIHCSENPMEGVRKRDRKKLDERLAKRAVLVDKVLVDFGFVPSTGVERASLSRGDGKPKATLPKAKLGVVVGDKGTNVLRGNTSVGTYGGSVDTVVLVPEVKMMVYWWIGQNEDGCPTDHAGVGKLAI